MVVRLDFDTYDTILRELDERRDPVPRSNEKARTWQQLRDLALRKIDTEAVDADDLRQEITAARNRNQFLSAIRSSNRIDVDDDGDGMSIKTLKDVYLTIGTSNRAREREQESGKGGGDHRIILGEKGLGRLSAMRLGEAMEVITGTVGIDHWSVLEIDWNEFANAPDDDIGSIEVEPSQGKEKKRSERGTLIRITSLTSPWSYKKLEELARDSFSKLTDPFSEKKLPVCTENPIRVDDVMESPKLAE